MSEANQNTPENNDPSSNEEKQGSVTSKLVSEPKLYAGKYKSVEELEKAYGHSVNAFVEKSKVEKELERYKVPDKYSRPDGLTFREEDFNEVESIAKNSDLSQHQYERMLKEMHTKVVTNAELDKKAMEDRRTTIGQDKINLLEDYVEKNYPASIREVVLNKLLRDESAMTDALKDRDQKLNSQVPGLNSGRGSSHEPYDGQKEVMEAGKVWLQNRGDKSARDKFIKLATEVGHERQR